MCLFCGIFCFWILMQSWCIYHKSLEIWQIQHKTCWKQELTGSRFYTCVQSSLSRRKSYMINWMKRKFRHIGVSKIFDWRYFYTKKSSVSTIFRVKNCGKEQNGRSVLIWKIWRFLSMGKKKISIKAIGKIVNNFVNIFVYMKVFICFPLVPSSGKCFSATFSSHIFLFKSHISSLHNSTLWLWNSILFFTCSSFYKMLHFLKKLFSFRGESEGVSCVSQASSNIL